MPRCASICKVFTAYLKPQTSACVLCLSPDKDDGQCFSHIFIL
jgi:hypothetical protein